MSKPKGKAPSAKPDSLFDRVASILDQARKNVVRTVNTNMVLAYWLTGREIVEESQRGKGRAKYGEKMIEDLSAGLTERYGGGFSPTTLQYFRKFYLAYPERCSEIPRPTGVESTAKLLGVEISRPLGAESTLVRIPFPTGTELADVEKLFPMGRELPSVPIPHPTGTELVPAGKGFPAVSESSRGFSPQLSWSHYRALIRAAGTSGCNPRINRPGEYASE